MGLRENPLSSSLQKETILFVAVQVHMPRIGTGAAGGDWGVIEEIIEEEMVRSNLTVTIYDLPPRREQFELFS